MFEHERSLVTKYEGRPFVLLGVDGDEERETLQDTQKKYHLNWRSWWDGDHSIGMRWGVEGLPTFVFIDHKGMIRGQFLGVPPSAQALEDAIERLVKEAESDAGKQTALNQNR